MADDSFYQDGAGTQHPDFGTQDELVPPSSNPGTDWQTALRPVTIRQMHDAKLPYTGADFIIDGKQVRYLIVVAHVVDADIDNNGQIRRITYTLEDGTSRGRIKAYHSGAPEDAVPVFPLQYGRFSGTLLRRGQTNFLKINHLRAVVDPHEIYHHLLEVVAVGLIYERGHPRAVAESHSGPVSFTLPSNLPPNIAIAPSSRSEREASPDAHPDIPDTHTHDHDHDSMSCPPDSDSDEDSEVSFKTAGDEIENDSNPWSTLKLAGASELRERDPYSHLTSVQREILLYLYNLNDSAETGMGAYVGNIVWSLRTKGVDVTSLGVALEELCDEGYIDEPRENHFRLTYIPARASRMLL